MAYDFVSRSVRPILSYVAQAQQQLRALRSAAVGCKRNLRASASLFPGPWQQKPGCQARCQMMSTAEETEPTLTDPESQHEEEEAFFIDRGLAPCRRLDVQTSMTALLPQCASQPTRVRCMGLYVFFAVAGLVALACAQMRSRTVPRSSAGTMQARDIVRLQQNPVGYGSADALRAQNGYPEQDHSAQGSFASPPSPTPFAASAGYPTAQTEYSGYTYAPTPMPAPPGLNPGYPQTTAPAQSSEAAYDAAGFASPPSNLVPMAQDGTDPTYPPTPVPSVPSSYSFGDRHGGEAVSQSTSPPVGSFGHGAYQTNRDASMGTVTFTREAFSSTTTTTTTPTYFTTLTTTNYVTLYCWALMLPHGYERGLMRHLLQANLSIFQCDSYEVFSDGQLEVGPGPPRVVTQDIGSTKVGFGGKYHNALNSGVFERAWRQVFASNKYYGKDWVVKVDPDTVFLPDRLRAHLNASDPTPSVYLNDCDQGLHGPIEIVSKGGMQTFRLGLDRCVVSLSKEWSWAGEDVFLRHCFGMLQIDRVDDWLLLSEAVCMWHDPVHKGCTTGHISFHPFKTEDQYFKCLKQAHEASEE